MRDNNGRSGFVWAFHQNRAALLDIPDANKKIPWPLFIMSLETWAKWAPLLSGAMDWHFNPHLWNKHASFLSLYVLSSQPKLLQSSSVLCRRVGCFVSLKSFHSKSYYCTNCLIWFDKKLFVNLCRNIKYNKNEMINFGVGLLPFESLFTQKVTFVRRPGSV